MTGFPEHSVVRTRVDLIDDQGRPVPAGSRGAVVHVYAPGQAYVVEVVLVDADGVQRDAHLFDAQHDQLDVEG